MQDQRTLEDLRRLLVEFRDRRDWKQFHSVKNLAMSVSIESAELLELFQWKSDANVDRALEQDEFRSNIASEIADVMIYLVLLAGELDIDPLEAAFTKVGLNETRFPVGSV